MSLTLGKICLLVYAIPGYTAAGCHHFRFHSVKRQSEMQDHP
jgi:hypothetical protein